jgi:hypothetical protein
VSEFAPLPSEKQIRCEGHDGGKGKEGQGLGNGMAPRSGPESGDSDGRLEGRLGRRIGVGMGWRGGEQNECERRRNFEPGECGDSSR